MLGSAPIRNIANQIIAGSINVGIAIGAESMRTNPDGGSPEMSAKIMSHPIVSQKQQPMGQTSDDAALLHHGTSTNGMVPMSLSLYQYYTLFLLPPSLASQRCQLPVACNTSTSAYTREIGNILVYTA